MVSSADGAPEHGQTTSDSTAEVASTMAARAQAHGRAALIRGHMEGHAHRQAGAGQNDQRAAAAAREQAQRRQRVATQPGPRQRKLNDDQSQAQRCGRQRHALARQWVRGFGRRGVGQR